MSSSRSCRPRRPKRNRAEFGAGGRPGETTHANNDGSTGRAENRPGTEIFKGGFGFGRGPRGPLPIHPCHLAIATEHSMHRNIFFEIGRAHVCTPVTNAKLVCRLLLEKK